MAYDLPSSSNTSFNLLSRYWNSWKEYYQRSMTQYYNRRIEQFPEASAQAYWQQLTHCQSGFDVNQINDEMLSRFMLQLRQQGISKFAVDCFILELRRLHRCHSRAVQVLAIQK
ncbi:MAG: hypothetical protein MUF49_22590 [Oculatellaceae cyanobacterium Prado106]|jgi:hypothetical protein|nr:hypothetical protein [Oculatellaceae cyanobacterium Prado106]